ncbi:hypothetical protein HS088_TW02G00538 [Tripterygium wilfordii]|uniref:Son of sevenless n=1 Tax=Tripterygium wilfordii TaxID=458696 RepID=A0A7J7DZA6_TRIWF|nr:uncharacterized protein LOC120014259 [Tripterygium wilfordii]KAF5751524.1 hypothetical protein HS088_TW02G00538 [Tripterygium wilfordii]
MEVSTGTCSRIRFDELHKDGSEELQAFRLESAEFGDGHNYEFRSKTALEVLRETVRILRYNAAGFMLTAVVLICPVSAIFLSNLLVDQSIVKKLTIRLMLVAKSSGFPMKPFIKQCCHRFSEMIVSSAICFPFFITLSLLSKAAVVYSVDSTYSKKRVDFSKLYVILRKIWRRLVLTYVWVCMVSVGCITSFSVLLVVVCSTVSVIGFSPDLLVYVAVMLGLVFSVVLANAIIICNTAIVISVLEDVSGPQALLRAGILIKGQTQVGLLIFLGSTIGMTFVEGLFEHRVKTLSYGDGSSRIWEGPLLVMMYSFVVLIDLMMSAVFYFSCRSYSMEASDDECHSILETMAISPEAIAIE